MRVTGGVAVGERSREERGGVERAVQRLIIIYLFIYLFICLSVCLSARVLAWFYIYILSVSVPLLACCLCVSVVRSERECVLRALAGVSSLSLTFFLFWPCAGHRIVTRVAREGDVGEVWGRMSA